MPVACAAVLLLLLTAGCARVKPDAPVSEPQTVATQPGTAQAAAEPPAPATPQPAAKPATPAKPQPAAESAAPATPQPVATPAAAAAPQPAATPAPRARTPAPQAAREVAPPVAKTPPAAPPLDLNSLKEELRATKAIGFFTKITLKNQVDDLLDQFRAYYQGKAKLTMMDLRRSYDLLMMKVLSLLQEGDQKLASAIVASREAIWGLLSDPKAFAILLQG